MPKATGRQKGEPRLAVRVTHHKPRAGRTRREGRDGGESSRGPAGGGSVRGGADDAVTRSMPCSSAGQPRVVEHRLELLQLRSFVVGGEGLERTQGPFGRRDVAPTERDLEVPRMDGKAGTPGPRRSDLSLDRFEPLALGTALFGAAQLREGASAAVHRGPTLWIGGEGGVERHEGLVGASELQEGGPEQFQRVDARLGVGRCGQRLQGRERTLGVTGVEPRVAQEPLVVDRGIEGDGGVDGGEALVEALALGLDAGELQPRGGRGRGLRSPLEEAREGGPILAGDGGGDEQIGAGTHGGRAVEEELHFEGEPGEAPFARAVEAFAQGRESGRVDR